MIAPRPAKSDRLLNALSDYERIFIVTHDNPDPDAVATGWAVWLMIKERLGKDVRLVGGGFISRAENRHMVKLLEPPIELLGDLACPADAAVVLVDCQPGNQDYLFCEEDVNLVGVIDHHSGRRRRKRPPFWDVRPRVAASASIAASYLREQKLDPGTRLATALLFAIRTETQGTETHYSRLDRRVLPWLAERSDPSRLAEIENAPLPPQYYSDLVLALQNTFLYDDAAFCLLPRASGPEIVGEVADLLIRCQSIGRVLCGAAVAGDLLLSFRTDIAGEDAAMLAQKTLTGIGRGGGHRRRAGGKVPNIGPKITEDLEDDLRNRWLATCGVDRQRGTRLVALREIVENL
jgi:nanoRNase/pAp phosphatase (c-di-AMP/oligoRNAs hydrolase)